MAISIKSSITIKEQIIAWPFTVGSVILLAWFLWQWQAIERYDIIEWLVFYGIALQAWEPAAAWLRRGARWIPAAELFFFAHILYYVAPFVNARTDNVVNITDMRLKTGLVIAFFLLVCRLFYRIPHRMHNPTQTFWVKVLNRELRLGRRKQFVWFSFVGWVFSIISFQQSWFPDMGSYLNTVRTFISSIGIVSVFILFYDFGCGKFGKLAIISLISLSLLSLLFTFASGFLIGGTIQAVVAFAAFSIGKKKLPLASMIFLLIVISFLHAGKGEMRARFWDGGMNFSQSVNSPISIYQVWVEASWNKLTSTQSSDEKISTIFDRGDLLYFLQRVVTETPDTRPYMEGLTFQQSLVNFIPRFLWPDKQRASTPDETLAIYYGFQTIESVEFTAVGLGKISEAWANYGWFGLLLIGTFTGLFLSIPGRLSNGYSPQHFRFALAISFITYSVSLEAGTGTSIHAFSQAFIVTFACLWIVTGARKNNSTVEVAEQDRHITSTRLPLQTTYHTR